MAERQEYTRKLDEVHHAAVVHTNRLMETYAEEYAYRASEEEGESAKKEVLKFFAETILSGVAGALREYFEDNEVYDMLNSTEFYREGKNMDKPTLREAQDRVALIAGQKKLNEMFSGADEEKDAVENFSDPATDRVEKDFLPVTGEGENMMSQAVTATTKLIYKWFNDGDVFDNNYGLEGWANDLSSYANWLDENIPEAEPILARIRNVGRDRAAYTALLYDLMHTIFTDEMIIKYADKPKEGTIYDCDGPYNFYEAPTCPECGQECDEWDIDHYGMCSDCYNDQCNNDDGEEDFYESKKITRKALEEARKASRKRNLKEEDGEEQYLTYKGHTCGWFKEDGVLFFNDDVKGKPNNWESYDRRALSGLKKRWKADIDQNLAKMVKESAKKGSKRPLKEAHRWVDFDKFKNTDKYLPVHGDGDNKGTQAATALSKLIYKWFNDGDVFDNTYGLTGWANDISGSANWLYRYVPEAQPILDRIKEIGSDKIAYTDLLYDLITLVDPQIPALATSPKEGDAYDEDGPFEFQSYPEEENDYYYD